MKILLELFFTFARIGGLTFGGGLAMLPMLKYELCEKRDWVTEDEIIDYYAIGQCTPGIIAVNTATFVGYKKKGVIGGVAATLGMVTPSVIIILLVASVLNIFMGNAILLHALAGIRIAACALITSTVVSLAKKGITDILCGVIFVAVLLISFFLDIPSIAIIAASGLAGIIAGIIKRRRKKA
ncbi:MAG: chromate transporter [Clostridia bacterium]|nr:chromate transporter [Clostridia bacterium]